MGSTGVEESYNDVLTGQDTSLQLEQPRRRCSAGRPQTNDVVLSLTETAQQAAADALAGQRGSVVALDVQTGAVLAMYSNPTFDPNGLVGPRHAGRADTRSTTINSGDEPALQRAYRDRYSPGSTFKVVTSKSAIEAGIATPDDRCSPSRTASRSRAPTPTLRQLRRRASVRRHAAREPRSTRATRRSRSSATSSATSSRPRCSSAASTSAPPIDLAPERGRRASDRRVGADKARFALAGIGQGDVFTTPLQMALIAAGHRATAA